MEKPKRNLAKTILTHGLSICAFIVFLGFTIFSILDLLKVLNNFPQIAAWWSNIGNANNLIILLFATVGLGDLISQWIDHSELKRMSDRIEMVFAPTISKTKIVYLESKSDFYVHFTKILENAPVNTHIYVTDFEKNDSEKYDKGEIDITEAFMRLWDNKIKKQQVIVTQLIHVTTKKNYDDAIKRCDKYKKNSNFEEHVMFGYPIMPFIDLCIIGDVVLIAFSSEVSSPNRISFGVAIEGHEVANKFLSYFQTFCSPSYSYFIKGTNANPNQIMGLRDKLPEIIEIPSKEEKLAEISGD